MFPPPPRPRRHSRHRSRSSSRNPYEVGPFIDMSGSFVPPPMVVLPPRRIVRQVPPNLFMHSSGVPRVHVNAITFSSSSDDDRRSRRHRRSRRRRRQSTRPVPPPVVGYGSGYLSDGYVPLSFGGHSAPFGRPPMMVGSGIYSGGYAAPRPMYSEGFQSDGWFSSSGHSRRGSSASWTPPISARWASMSYSMDSSLTPRQRLHAPKKLKMPPDSYFYGEYVDLNQPRTLSSSGSIMSIVSFSSDGTLQESFRNSYPPGFKGSRLTSDLSENEKKKRDAKPPPMEEGPPIRNYRDFRKHIKRQRRHNDYSDD